MSPMKPVLSFAALAAICGSLSTSALAVNNTGAAAGVPSQGVPQTPNMPNGGGTRMPGGDGPSRGIPLPNLPLPNLPSFDGPNGDRPSGQTGGGDGPAPPKGSVDGLPDAVTILDILRGLPHWPGAGPVTGETVGPPDAGPKSQGRQPADTQSPPSPPPRRVVAVNPGLPFVPRPTPRLDTTPPVIIGAVVPEIRDREVIVSLAPSANPNIVDELSRALGLDGDTLYTSNLLGTRVVRFRIPDQRSVADVIQQLSTDARVQTVQPNYVFTASDMAAKPLPLPVPQYAPQMLHLDEAHKLANGRRVKIAVIDTAIDTTHPAFAGSITSTFDALGDSKPEPELHGTSIAGILGARSGLEGVAPEATVLGVRAFTSNAKAPAQSYTLAILKGLDWAVLNGARVVNMSFAGPNDPLLGQAISAAFKQGVVIVAAAGNGGASAGPAYPGAFPNVIAVTAVDTKDVLYKGANRGTYIAVAAPGVDIIAPAPKGAYDISTGTSMAAAHVSGIAALMLEKNPKLTPKEIRDALSKSARSPARMIAEEVGAGVVDAAEALKVR